MGRGAGLDADVTVLRASICGARGETLAIVGAVGIGQEHAAAPAGRAGRAQRRPRAADGRDLGAWSPAVQGALRNRHLGFVYQFHHLLPEFSARSTTSPCRIRWIRRQAAAERRARRSATLAPSAQAGRAQHRPSELSGGESAWRPSPALVGNRPACWPTEPRATWTAPLPLR